MKVFSLSLCIFLYSMSICFAQGIPMPARIGGTLHVNDVLITQAEYADYTICVTTLDGQDIVDSYGNTACDTDGLNDDDWYLIDIPIYDEQEQPTGVSPGEAVQFHFQHNETTLPITSPPEGHFTVGVEGSLTQIDVYAGKEQNVAMPWIPLLLSAD